MQSLYSDFSVSTAVTDLLVFSRVCFSTTCSTLSGFGLALNQAFYCIRRSHPTFACVNLSTSSWFGSSLLYTNDLTVIRTVQFSQVSLLHLFSADLTMNLSSDIASEFSTELVIELCIFFKVHFIYLLYIKIKKKSNLNFYSLCHSSLSA